jgi:hypothetical protein
MRYNGSKEHDGTHNETGGKMPAGKRKTFEGAELAEMKDSAFYGIQV